ncbi:MAG: SURF1 family protein [Paracoccaceae bacterium]
MTRRMIAPILFGIFGIAVLIWLGVWQLHRLQWKETMLADIGARITAAPVALPASPDPVRDRFLPVEASGTLGAELRVLTSVKQAGPGYRILNVFDTGGRRVLLDRGFMSNRVKEGPLPEGPVHVIGNLHWPDETDSFTPDPEIDKNLWFARDVSAMADQMGTEPVLIVARRIDPPSDTISPLPVDTSGIPNNHLQYAITWFLLAVVWLGMTGLLLWRIRQRAD